jgi:hypothetical protein
MAYTKTNWQARQGSGLNRFTKSGETDTTVVLTPSPENVTVPGTPFTAENMNHIEGGIEAAHDGIAAEETARETGDAAIEQALAGEASARESGDQYLQAQLDSFTPEGQENLVQALAAEAQAREQADAGLQDQIDLITAEGCLSSVTTDDSLTGNGTRSNPLGVSFPPGTKIYPLSTSGTVSTAPDGARVDDLILNSYSESKTIGGVSIAIGGLAKITSLSPFTCTAAGNIRGAQGAQGAQGVPGAAGVNAPTVGLITNNTIGATISAIYTEAKGYAIGSAVVPRSVTAAAFAGDRAIIGTNGTLIPGSWQFAGETGFVSSDKFCLIRRVS